MNSLISLLDRSFRHGILLTLKAEVGTKEAYHELLQLQERSKKLTKVREELEQRSQLRGKGVAIQVAEGGKNKAAQYRWLYDRKR
eukprot:symbB.v1.2.002042.t1/scaffold105.1/size328853/8